jgi:hypothetical protein
MMPAMTKKRMAASTAAAIVPAGIEELLLDRLVGLVVKFPNDVVFRPPTRKARVRFCWLTTAI